MKYIGLISPYSHLAELAKKHNISAEVGDSYGAIIVANKMIKNGVEVIISRGGTSLILKDNVHVPVVTLNTSSIEIMKKIKEASIKSKNIGICGHANFIHNIKDMESLIDVNLTTVLLSNDDSMDITTRKVNSLKNRVDIIVGDKISVNIAEKLGMDALLIETGEDSLIQSINEAKKIRKAIITERMRFKELNLVLDHTSDAIISTNMDSRIKYFNPAAEKIFQISKDKAHGQEIHNVFPINNIHDVINKGKSFEQELFNIGKKTIIGNVLPIVINKRILGAIYIFRDISDIQYQEEKIRKKIYLKGHVAKYTFKDMISGDEEFDELIQIAKLYAQTDSNVLITGETGTGKEFFAQSIHNESKRMNRPFVAINCAALPDNLLESELFGYEEGAFTGARKGGKKGLFELAHGGTIFLDEIGEIALHIQIRLLRVLQEKQLMRLGSDKVIPIDVRIIAATNVNLQWAIDNKEFREDLFFRLNILNLNIIPLRKRKSALPVLTKYFIKTYCKQNNIKEKIITDEALELLSEYDWPGNIRELQNIIERIIIIIKEDVINRQNLEKLLLNTMLDFNDTHEINIENSIDPYKIFININKSLKEIDKEIIERSIEVCEGNKTQAANMLKISRATLWRWINGNGN